jgi:DNA-binding NarL/FixJ family response regulator
VLELMAQGCSNAGVACRLHLSERTVEATSAHVFRKLGLEPSPLTNRRVLAVLTFMSSRGITALTPPVRPGRGRTTGRDDDPGTGC